MLTYQYGSILRLIKRRSRLPGTLPLGFLIFLLIPILSRGDATLQGRITDIDTGFGIEGAIIELDLDPPADGIPEFSTDTDPFGFYTLPGISAGTYQLTVSHPAYQSQTQAQPLAEDEIAAASFALDRLDASVIIFDVYAQILCVTSGIQLADVPVRVQRFTTSDGSDTPETRILMTEVDGAVVFRGMQEGWYRFRANHPNDGNARTRWKFHETNGTPSDLTRLEQAHMASFLLEPADPGQNLNVKVTGFDPRFPEQANRELRDFWVEVTGVDPNPAVLTVPLTYPVLIPTRTNATNNLGEAFFNNLPAIGYKVTVKKMGYVMAEETILPDGNDNLVNEVMFTPDLIPRSLFIFMTHPYFGDDPDTVGIVESAQFLFRDIPVYLEGLKDTATEGISRMSMVHEYRDSTTGELGINPFTGTGAADFQDGRTFRDLLPGRYRVWVDGRSPDVANLLFFPDDAISFVTNPHFVGEIIAELDPLFPHQAQLTSVAELRVRVLPAVVRGRLFAADETSTIKLRGNQDNKPIYKPMMQTDIHFVEFNSPEENFGQLLPDGSRIIPVNTDENGEFTVCLLPAEYGIKIEGMTDYWGSHIHLQNVTEGTGISQGWPFSEE